MKISLRRRRVVLGLVLAVVLVGALVAVVLAYPAWSAKRGDDAHWVANRSAAALLDYDDKRMLAVDSEGELLVFDRATGASRRMGRVDLQRRAALLPGGVVSSVNGRLVVTDTDGEAIWKKESGGGYTLLAVDVEAGVVVAADDRSPYNVVGFDLADGTPVWTVEDVARVGNIRVGVEPARPPGAFRNTGLVPVLRRGDYPGPGEPYRPEKWSLLNVVSGGIMATTEMDNPDSPVAAGDVAVPGALADCGDLSILGGPDVTWPGEPPAVECEPVWAFDTERVLVPVRVGPDKFAATDDVRLHSVDLASGKITELDWTGTLADTLVDRDGKELTRSWGRYLFADGAVYDTRTGAEKWRGDDVWLASDTGLVAEDLSWIDKLAPGDGDRWLKVVDAATGEPAAGGYITDDEVVEAYVLDRGEAVVFTTEETIFLTSE